MSHLKLSIGDSSKDISMSNYIDLCDNFIFVNRNEADRYKSQGSITFSQLRDLCRKNKLSYPLFFAETTRIKELIEVYNTRLYGKIDENTVLVLGSREGDLDIRRIRWIIADISEKQKIYKKHGYNKNLQNDGIVKFLKNSQKSVEEQAMYICNKVSMFRDDIQKSKSKNEALKYIERTLGACHIHVYREVKNAMPQNLPDDLMISGVYIRDNYNPAIFIGNELSLYPDEGVGRKIYTTVFLLVSIFKDYSFAVKINHDNPKMDDITKKKLSEIHMITNEILMPKEYFKSVTINDISDIEREARILKVSPTALTVRLAKLKILQKDTADEIKERLKVKYEFYIRKKRIEDKGKRNAGINTGPPLSKIYKSYHGDFIEFIKSNVPDTQRKIIFESRVSYGRGYAKYEDLYG